MYIKKAQLKHQPQQHAALLIPGQNVELMKTATLRNFDVPLCDNMAETPPVTAISEQGGKEAQHGKDERHCPPSVTRDGNIGFGNG